MINSMENLKEHILLIVSDPEVSMLIAQQTLQPLGYPVDVIESGYTAVKEIVQISPDLIITDLALSGMSAKDLLVVLTSQGIDLPIIVITPKGREIDALQAFRLGAMNFLTYPLREAEVVNVVEDTLEQFRKRKALEYEKHKLDQNKQRLEQQVGGLIEVFSIAKLVPSVANQQALYDKVIHTAVKVTKAELGWITVLDFQKDKYILRACLTENESLQPRLNQPYEDSLSALVKVSHQVVSVHGAAAKSFDVIAPVESLLAMPIKWKDEVVGMLVVARKTDNAFTSEQQTLLEMVVDYTSALIENARRYQILEQRLFMLQQSIIYTSLDANLKNDLLHQASLELRNPLKRLLENLQVLVDQPERRMGHKQAVALSVIQEEADILVDIADALVKIQQRETSRMAVETDLNVMVNEVVNRFTSIAHVCRISLRVELPAVPSMVTVFPTQITRVIEGMVSNALKYSPPKSQITIQVEKKSDHTLVVVKNQGSGIEPSQVERMFDKKSSLFGEEARRFGGIGISLPVIKEIITAHKGEVWIDSGHGKGFTICCSLPN
jgi:K+-sensing histidine kinase KdpD/AmiR/NasT family two-component response regulator